MAPRKLHLRVDQLDKPGMPMEPTSPLGANNIRALPDLRGMIGFESLCIQHGCRDLVPEECCAVAKAPALPSHLCPPLPTS